MKSQERRVKKRTQRDYTMAFKLAVFSQKKEEFGPRFVPLQTLRPLSEPIFMFFYQNLPSTSNNIHPVFQFYY